MTGRTTIDFGIDLGTTNSAIAMLRGANAEIIRNNEGCPTTPSAVWVDRRGRVHVGRRAKDRQDTDPDNTCLEFKRRMGTTGAIKRLAGIGMTPQLLSAQVLRSLRIDVGQRLGEPPAAAVITVPAGFTPSARDATRYAAGLAGFRSALLLPEPVAAAYAHGLHAMADDTTWLVYDLGGGFGAAVVRSRDGQVSVVRHTRDRLLGGTVIDWRLVGELLIPAAVQQHPALAGLSRGDPRWSTAIAALRSAAERAKIALSQHECADIEVELIDERHRRYRFHRELSRAEVERLTEPVLARSIDLCRRTLRGFGSVTDGITKIILTGGQTMLPHLRDRLADPVHGLGIPPVLDADPLTVVARGAAVYAGTRPLAAEPPPIPLPELVDRPE